MKNRWGLLIGLLCVFAASCSQSPVTDEYGSVVEEPVIVDSVAFNQAMSALVTSSAPWLSLDSNLKTRAVDVMINLYKVRENAAILNSSKFYVQKIDESLSQDRDLASVPFPQLIKILAVMEYDFYNGQDKDELARQILGDRLYESNKKRLEDEAAAAQP